MRPKSVAVIVGGGIAGLATAWWLDKAGWQSIVVERAERFRTGGYVVSITGHGYQTLKDMDLLDEVKARGLRFDTNIIKESNGKELCRIGYHEIHLPLEYVSVCRDDLARVLVKALPESSTIRFGETVSDFTEEGEKIRTTLAGGDVIEADLLIGADGFRSEIRQKLYQDDNASYLEPMGYYYAAYNFEHEGGAEDDRVCHSFNSPGQMDMFFPSRVGTMTAMHIWRENRNLSVPKPQDKFDVLHGLAAKSAPEAREAVERAEREGALVNMDSLTLVTLPQWSKGRVVLLGDAAHCLTLLSGQGAGMALVSSEILGKELQKTTDVLEALRNHEAKLRPAIERLQARSRRLAMWYIPGSTIAYHIRNFILRLMPHSWLVAFHVNTIKQEIDLT
ncbi:hypothetical protein DV738_g5089, partial [Chaetothyriales sp. CBS 135597]